MRDNMIKQRSEVPAESKSKNLQNKGKLSYLFPSVLMAAIAINGCSAIFRPSSMPSNIPLAEQITQVDETAQTPEQRAKEDPSIFANKVYVGETITKEGYTAKLEPMSIPYEGIASKANIQISDPSDTIVDTVSLGIGESKEIKVGVDTVVVSVYDVRPSITPLDSWADIDLILKSETNITIKYLP
jgi:hypothetical protein